MILPHEMSSVFCYVEYWIWSVPTLAAYACLRHNQCLPTRDNGSWSTSTRSIRDASFVLLVIVCFCLRCHGVSLFCACGLVAAWWTRLLPLRLRLRRLPLLLLPPVRRRVFTQCFCQQAARQDLSAKRQLCGDVGYSAQMGGPPTVCTGSLREKTRISSPLLARNGFATAISRTICIVCFACVQCRDRVPCWPLSLWTEPLS